MELSSPLRRIAFAAVLGALTVMYASRCVREYRASAWASSTLSSDIRKATILEPGNAEYHNRFASFEQYVSSPEDLSEVLAHYKEATRLNPWVSRYWLDLANAYMIADDNESQANALGKAAAMDPVLPSTSAQVGYLLLTRGEDVRALKMFRRVLESDLSQSDAVFASCWRSVHDPDLIETYALPPTPQAHIALLRFFVSQDENAAAAKAWARLIQLNESFPPEWAFGYIGYLLDGKQADAAREAWLDLAKVNPMFRSYLPGSNLVVNGSFEEHMLNGGLHWFWKKQPGVTLSIDTTHPHQGTRSLAINFDTEIEDAGIGQYLLLKPNTHYVFTAAYRADSIESAHGFRFSLMDAYTSIELLQSEEMTGTSPWRLVTQEFTTQGTQVAVLRLARAHGLLKGRLWIDDVSVSEQ